MKRRIGLLLVPAWIVLTTITLWAQEPRQESRGVTHLVGNITASAGYVFSGGSPVRDYRTNTTITTAGAATYTAAQVLTGLITRTPGVGGNVTDVLPTAATLATAANVTAAGMSFWLVVDLGTNPGGSVTLNGASTGVTYSEGCGTALTTSGAYPVLIVFTSTSAYRAVCMHGDV